jgi:hypothetical protein
MLWKRLRLRIQEHLRLAQDRLPEAEGGAGALQARRHLFRAVRLPEGRGQAQEGRSGHVQHQPGSANTDLSRIDGWQLCKAETTAVSLDVPFELSLLPADLAKLEDMLLVVKYGFS